MGRSKRFKVAIITSEGSRRFGNNAPPPVNRRGRSVSSGPNHKIKFSHDVDEKNWSAVCMECPWNLESSFDELVEAVLSAEGHGKIAKLVVDERYEELIKQQIREIRMH